MREDEATGAPAARTGAPITFVTVVFRGDLALLRVQARSMARFLNPADVSAILLILNDVDEATLRADIQGFINDYGGLKDKVHIVPGDEVLLRTGRHVRRPLFERIYVENRFRLPFLRRSGWRGGNGYRLQQALKLASARAAPSENMVILDGKNIFLRAPSTHELFLADGRASADFLPVRADHHRNWLRESLDVLAVPEALRDVTKTTGYSTPYPVKRSLLLNLLAEIDTRFGSVQALFASKRRPSEFMLIFAYCLKHFGGAEAVFADAGRRNIGLWGDFDADRIDAVLAQAEAETPLTFGLHRKAVSALSPAQNARLRAVFDARGIDIWPLMGEA